ncbi:MAG: hypothetical protein DMF56_10370 [Acidobacteria bacterium]|nr:MAG: hypothetical protein DMF56_10370 [Acidobacteriota bacterium]
MERRPLSGAGFLASDWRPKRNYPHVAIRRFNLAMMVCDAGDLPRAHELFVEALAAHERSLGDDHPYTALTRVSLANVLHRLGETKAAFAEAESALRAVEGQPEGSQFRTRVEHVAKKVLNEP